MLASRLLSLGRVPSVLRSLPSLSPSVPSSSSSSLLSLTPQGRASTSYSVVREHDLLVERYREAGGCMSCLREGRIVCEGGAAVCPEKDEDRAFFRILRTSILDNRDRIFSRDRKRAELQIPEKPPGKVSLDDWQSFFASRGITGATDPKSQRFLSKPLTFPLSVAQFLGEKVDYPLTPEGKKAFDELRQLMNQASDAYLRICFVGVRAELSFPATFWRELGLIFPNSHISLIMVGPEAPLNLDKHSMKLSDNVSLSCYRRYYHEIHDDLASTNYVPDLYVALNSGIGFEGYNGSWDQTFKTIMDTKKPLLLSSHDLRDQERDVAFLKNHERELNWLLHPSDNKFKSLFHDVLAQNIRYIINSNWSIFAVQGK